MINGINLTDFYASKVLLSKVQNFFSKRRQQMFDYLFFCLKPHFPENRNNSQEQLNESNYISNQNYKSLNQSKQIPNTSELLSSDEYEERLKHIKLGILHVKLLSLTEIIQKEIKFKYIFFIEKVRLKMNMEHLFKIDDNFLYFFPQQKLFKFANNYAYRRLSYVFKSYKYRMNFLIRNVFNLWKFQTHLSALVTIPEKEAIMNQNCISLVTLLNDIIVKHRLIHSIQKLIFFYWVNISKQDKYELDRINKGALFLQHFFHKYKQAVFHDFPNRNFTYTKLLYQRLLKHLNSNALYKELSQNDSINKEEIEKIMMNAISTFKNEKMLNYSFNRKNKLLKIFIQQNLRNTCNKGLYNAFKKLKSLTTKNRKQENEIKILNDEVIDLKCDSLINGSLIIQALFKQKILCDILYQKQRLIDGMRDKITLKNTLFEYGENYQKIISMLPKERRIDLLIVRNKYKKIFALKKILLTMFKHQFDLSENNHSIQKKYLEGCFYRWKAYICESVRKRNLKIFLLSHIALKLEQKMVFNIRNKFLTNLIINAYSKTEKRKFWLQSSAVLIKKIKKVFLKNTLAIFFQVFFKEHQLIKQNQTIALKLLSIYSKRYKLKKKLSLPNKLDHFFQKWYNKTRLLFDIKEIALIDKNILNKYFVLHRVIELLMRKQKRNYIKKWRTKVRKHYYKSNNSSIDSKIIQNMSTILLEYEIEDTKVKHDIIRCKFAMSKGKALLRCIYAKQMHTIMIYFLNWRRNEKYSPSFGDLIKEADNIKNENEELIKTYYEKKNQYKKIIYDYEYMKNHYCNKCMGENIEIDYKSINDEILSEGNDQEENINENQKGTSSNPHFGNNHVNNSSEDFCIDSHEESMNKPNVKNKLVEKENIVTHYKNEYENQLKYYEDHINTLKQKKEELLSIKKMLLEKRTSKR